MAISFRIASDFKANGNCRFTASNLLTHTQSYSSILPKHSPYTKLIDKEYIGNIVFLEIYNFP